MEFFLFFIFYVIMTQLWRLHKQKFACHIEILMNSMSMRPSRAVRGMGFENCNGLPVHMHNKIHQIDESVIGEHRRLR